MTDDTPADEPGISAYGAPASTPIPTLSESPVRTPGQVQRGSLFAPENRHVLVALGGGVAVFVGSRMPFIADPSHPLYEVSSGALTTSLLFGLVLAGLAGAMWWKPTATRGYAIALIALGALGAVGYLLFAAAGAAGVEEEIGFGVTTTITFSPGLGTGIALLT